MTEHCHKSTLWVLAQIIVVALCCLPVWCGVASKAAWTKIGPVIRADQGWSYVSEPTLMYEGTPQIFGGHRKVFKCWYRQYRISPVAVEICYAESVDGVTWTKGRPVLKNGNLLYCPFVMRNVNTYHLYVHHDWSRIDRYSSPDGITWTLDRTDVLRLGLPGQWDRIFGNVCVWKEGARDWRMLYEAANWSLSHAWKIGYATSADGLNWTKSVKNPVLTDVGSVGGPQVSKVGSRYHLWYQNSPTNALPTDIARASSEDLTSWRKYEGGHPVFLRTETYEGRGNNSITDGGQVADISMVEVGNRTFALYAAVPDQSSGTIAMAIAGTPIAGLVK